MYTPIKEDDAERRCGTPLHLRSPPMQLGYGTGIQVIGFIRPLDATGIPKSPWALKFVSNRGGSETIQSRLIREADILRKLNHPNIVGFRGLTKLQDGRDLLVMEECTTSLGKILRNRHDEKLGPLPAIQMKKVCQDICDALDYLHNTAYLLHGDIKSDNILIKNEFNICKLCDFGVSVPLNAEGYIDVIKEPTAQYIGSRFWCAPETLIDFNDRFISSKADIFSFGLVIYECIACITPHTHDTKTDEPEQNNKNESSGSEDEHVLDYEKLLGTRPPLPFVETLDVMYKPLIDIYYSCTNQMPEDRPTAKDVATILRFSQEQNIFLFSICRKRSTSAVKLKLAPHFENAFLRSDNVFA